MNEGVQKRPKRELPFGGSTDPRNIKAAQKSSNANENVNRGMPTANHDAEMPTDPLYYNSRPRRALPQINFNNNNKEKYVFIR